MDLVADVLLDSVVDTIKLVPFLLVTYLAMEAIEHSASSRVKTVVERSGAAGPLVGAALGALPQCGFSAMAATLFAGRVVTAGTLVAVILSTSDEMIPIFIARQAPLGKMLSIMGFKLLVGLVVGLCLDGALRARHIAQRGPQIHELCVRAHCHCEELEDGQEPTQTAHEAQPHAHGHAHGHGRWAILRSACAHTAQVSLFIFLVTLVCGLVIEGVGEDALGAILVNHPLRATFLTGLVGLVPNCGVTVVITELYLEGTLGAGPMMAGLLASGGMGLLVFWRTNPDVRQNLALTGFLYVVAVIVGLAIGASGILG